MKLYLAPMEGLTTYIYRTAFHHYFDGIDKFFTPFITSSKLGKRDLDEILPEHNEGMKVVPQIMTNRAEEFLSLATQLKDYGYNTVNLNLGCPSGTVVVKKRGSGMLSDLSLLENFLDEIYEKSPVNISIKTRIGISDLGEWEDILSIYRKYPIAELIVHPRLQKEFYLGQAHRDVFANTVAALSYNESGDKADASIPLCYNGDITSSASLEDYRSLILSECGSDRTEQIPVMIGRGVLRNPFLPDTLKEYPATEAVERSNASAAALTAPGSHTSYRSTPGMFTAEQLLIIRAFHDEIYEGYRERMSGTKPVMFKMKDLWTYLSTGFPDPDKKLKKIRKADRFPDYEIAVRDIFNCI